MSYSSRPYVNRYIPSNRFPLGLKWLLIANITIFVVGYILHGAGIDRLFTLFALTPADVVSPPFAAWQFVTNVFIHGTSFWFLLWNMLALWMFGTPLERLWGTSKFLRFYFISGIAASLAAFAVAVGTGATGTVIMGSVACINAILVAYGLIFPDQSILFGFLIPMKSKYFVMILGAIVILQSYAYIAVGKGAGWVVAAQMLTGLIAGFVLVRGKRMRVDVRTPVLAAYKDWKLRRAKRKFEVYLKNEDSKRNRRIR